MTRSRRSRSINNDSSNNNDTNDNTQNRSVAPHVRQRQREVAEREAARLARPEQRRRTTLRHADRKKSAVSSTPSGIYRSSNLKDGGIQEEEWCGPWSVARQMIASREEAKRKREKEELEDQETHPLDAVMEEVNLEQKKKIHPSMMWKGHMPSSMPTSLYAKRQKRADVQRGQKVIPTLFQLCVGFIVENIEYVERLGDVPNDVRVAISKELVERNQLDAQAFSALIEPTLETLEIPDCSGIPQDVMADTLQTIPGLRYLLLTHAGRCFGPKTVNSLLDTKAPLCCLSIDGAYLFRDEDASQLIEMNSSTLQSLVFDTCPLLGIKFIESISHTRNLLELSLKDLTLSEESLALLSGASNALGNVQSLTLQSISGMKDEILASMLQSAGGSLEALNASYNYDLTDICLSSIREFNVGLKSLSLNGVKEITAAGLETFFTPNLEGLPPPPKLKVLKLSSCDHQAVTDTVMEFVTASASGHVEHTDTERSDPLYMTRAGGLSQLEIEGSTLVTDFMLERLVDTSAITLKELNVSYCPSITDKGLGYLIGKSGLQLSKISVWGCAQLTDELFDGHSRVDDRTLEIVGAWMKRSGTRSLR